MSDKVFKIIVCGGRHFDDYVLLKSVVDKRIEESEFSPGEVEIVSGHCKGADMLGEKYAAEHGCSIKVFQADWGKYGRAAGPVRNKQMVDYIATAENKLVIAFVNENTKGTKNTVAYAKKAGIPVIEAVY